MKTKLERVKEILGERRMLLHEYYDRVDDPNTDNILGNLQVWIYKLDREEMTPHVHLILKEKSEIEVSLIDWKIVNVKFPKGVDKEWSNFTDIRDKFFTWLHMNSSDGISNCEKLFKCWDEWNPDNELYEHRDEKNASEEYKEYIDKISPSFDLRVFEKELYKSLSRYIFDEGTRKEIIKMDTKGILKYCGLDERYPIDNVILLEKAAEVIEKMKYWSS